MKPETRAVATGHRSRPPAQPTPAKSISWPHFCWAQRLDPEPGGVCSSCHRRSKHLQDCGPPGKKQMSVSPRFILFPFSTSHASTSNRLKIVSKTLASRYPGNCGFRLSNSAEPEAAQAEAGVGVIRHSEKCFPREVFSLQEGKEKDTERWGWLTDKKHKRERKWSACRWKVHPYKGGRVFVSHSLLDAFCILIGVGGRVIYRWKGKVVSAEWSGKAWKCGKGAEGWSDGRGNICAFLCVESSILKKPKCWNLCQSPFGLIRPNGCQPQKGLFSSLAAVLESSQHLSSLPGIGTA